MPRAKSHRGWCFTLNNPEENEQARISEVLGAESKLQYACGQLEVGENGTRHIQGYVEFKHPRTFKTVQRLLPRAHIEPRKGSPGQARAYCLKEETRAGPQWELGEFVPEAGQGARSDLSLLQQFLDGGGQVSEAYRQFPSVCARYPKFVRTYAQLTTAPRSWKTKVLVYVGPTGCGKTSRAHDEFPNIWTKPPGQWFDGYDRHEHVLFDDFDGGRESGIQYRELLRLTDRYPMLVPVKGDFVQWVPRVIVITTNVEPKQWYPCCAWEPLERRLDEIHRWPHSDS